MEKDNDRNCIYYFKKISNFAAIAEYFALLTYRKPIKVNVITISGSL